RELVADLQLDVGIAHLERLRVRVDGDELDALQALIDHAVDGVRPAAADADDLDDRQVAPCVHVGVVPLYRPKLKREWRVSCSRKTQTLGGVRGKCQSPSQEIVQAKTRPLLESCGK